MSLQAADAKESGGIEAHVQIIDAPSLIALLSSALGELRTDSPTDEALRIYECEGVVVVIQPSEDGFTSVWIRGDSPWPSSPALGRYLASHLSCIVLCDPEDEHPEIPPYAPVFLRIEGGHESLVTLD